MWWQERGVFLRKVNALVGNFCLNCSLYSFFDFVSCSCFWFLLVCVSALVLLSFPDDYSSSCSTTVVERSHVTIERHVLREALFLV